MPRSVAEPNGEVEAFAGEVDTVVVGQQTQVDARKSVLERLQARQQPSGGERADHADGDDIAKVAVGKAVQCRADAIEGIGDRRQQGLSLVGQRQAARQPAKQLHAQSVFQAFDLMADRGLRHPQFQAGAREGQLPRRCFEGAQGVQG